MTSTAGIGWELQANKKHYLPIVNADGWDEAVEVLSKTMLVHLPGNLGYKFSKLAMNYLVGKYQGMFASKKLESMLYYLVLQILDLKEILVN